MLLLLLARKRILRKTVGTGRKSRFSRSWLRIKLLCTHSRCEQCSTTCRYTPTHAGYTPAGPSRPSVSKTHLPFLYPCVCVHLSLCACVCRIFSFTCFVSSTYPCTFPHSHCIWCIFMVPSPVSPSLCLPLCPDLLSAWVSSLVLCGYKRASRARIRHHSSTALRTANNSATHSNTEQPHTTKCARTRTSSSTPPATT